MTETEDYPPDNSDITESILTEVAARAEAWRESQRVTADHRDALVMYAVAAARAGVSEYRLASAAGVTRVTIRSWQGKGRDR